MDTLAPLCHQKGLVNIVCSPVFVLDRVNWPSGKFVKVLSRSILLFLKYSNYPRLCSGTQLSGRIAANPNNVVVGEVGHQLLIGRWGLPSGVVTPGTCAWGAGRADRFDSCDRLDLVVRPFPFHQVHVPADSRHWAMLLFVDPVRRESHFHVGQRRLLVVQQIRYTDWCCRNLHLRQSCHFGRFPLRELASSAREPYSPSS